MKSRLVKFLLALIIVAAPTLSNAQDRGNRGDFEKRMKEQNDALKKDLKLDKKQAADFDKVQSDYTKKRNEVMAEMREGGGGDREAMREKMTEMREGLDKELKKVLTTKQFKEYEKIQAKKQAERGQRGQGRQGRGGMGGGRI